MPFKYMEEIGLLFVILVTTPYLISCGGSSPFKPENEFVPLQFRDDAASSKANKSFLQLDNQEEASKGLKGTWGARFAYVGGKDIELGTGDFTISGDDSGNLYFSSMNINKLVKPNVKVSGFAKQRRAEESDLLITSKTALEFPRNFSEAENSITLIDASKRLVRFKLNLSEDPIIKNITTRTTDGVLLISNDGQTIAGSDGSSFYIIAQKGIQPKHADLKDLQGTWQILSFNAYASTGEIIFNSKPGTISVDAPTSAHQTNFNGTDSNGNSISGDLFMPDKEMGASELKVTATTKTRWGGMLQSPDNKYVYGIFFDSSYEHFIGVKN